MTEGLICDPRMTLAASNFSFLHNVFKRLVMVTTKNKGPFGKGLTRALTLSFIIFWYINRNRVFPQVLLQIPFVKKEKKKKKNQKTSKSQRRIASSTNRKFMNFEKFQPKTVYSNSYTLCIELGPAWLIGKVFDS